MNCFRDLLINLFLLASLLLFSASLAEAHVLKGEHIIQLMLAENKPPARLRINQQVTLIGPVDEAQELTNRIYEERVHYRIPGEYRSDINDPDLRRIHLFSMGRSLSVIEGRILSQSEKWTDHYKDIFLYRSRKKMVERLESLGINFSVTSLGRYNGSICYILGADYMDESVPQIWVEKDTFLPVRWIFGVSGEKGAPKPMEILYENWKEHYRYRYPSEIKFYQGENLLQMISVRDVEINPPVSGDLFDIEHLKILYSQTNPGETDFTGQNDIEKRIEDFKQIYE